MKLEITQAGARMAGKELEKGVIIGIKGDAIPASLVNKAIEVKSGETAITNPADNPVQQPAGGGAEGYAVVDKGKGWFVVTHDGQHVTKSLRSDDIAGFAEMSDEDKAAFVDLHKADA
ncbi:hypothetical protein [Stappia sp.]|uniref:hypothetical protein n=1 Tax=Stappia sp. TaxID=1870903 RepID=UPI003C7ECC9B